MNGYASYNVSCENVFILILFSFLILLGLFIITLILFVILRRNEPKSKRKRGGTPKRKKSMTLVNLERIKK